jgi:hypothetical protein
MNNNKKVLLITKDSLLAEIQHAFTASFPFLKIDFIKPGIVAKPSRSSTIDPNTFVKHLSSIGTAIKIPIDNLRTIAEVTNDFKNCLGLVVDVSRKSGNVWNVISLTDGWTLESQNTAGKYISSVMEVPPEQN